MPPETAIRSISLFPGQPEPEPIRLRTLLLLRWIAVFGQLATVVAALLIGVSMPQTAVFATIGVAVLVNLRLTLGPPRRVTDRGAALQLGFDLWQIALLLALTGGMTNPFALLLLVPVTIAAATLPTRYMIALGIATAIMVSIAAIVAKPLSFSTGAPISLDEPYQFGHWAAILIGVVFLSTYAHRVSNDLDATSKALFAARMALEREQKLQHLGGVVAAAAHEMGTPLATIKLISGELQDELHDILPDRPDVAEDLTLLKTSADRCATILRSMGQSGKDDLMLRSAPLEDVLREAATPHMNRGVEVDIQVSGEADLVHRDAAVVHGLRNLVQNAVDFAKKRVDVMGNWGEDELSVTIRDDGPGYPPALLPRLGSPFLTTRPRAEDRRGYEGMGLGLFIAKALLERGGARVVLANERTGAVATVIWPRAMIETSSRKVLGENPEID